MADSVRPHRRQPTRLPRPWDSPGKNAGVGCHCLLLRRSQQSKSGSDPRVLWDRALPFPSLAILLLSMIRPMAKLPLPPRPWFPWWLRWYSLYLQCRRPGFDPWVRKMPWRSEWPLTPVCLPGKSHGQRSLVGYSPCGHKETDTSEQLIHTPHYRILSHRIHEGSSNPNMLCK